MFPVVSGEMFNRFKDRPDPLFAAVGALAATKPIDPDEVVEPAVASAYCRLLRARVLASRVARVETEDRRYFG